MASDSMRKSRKAREDWIHLDALCRGACWDKEHLSVPTSYLPGGQDIQPYDQDMSLGQA